MNARTKVVMIAGLLACTGCMSRVNHIAPYRAKERNFDEGIYAETAQATPGSLYHHQTRGLFEDDRARDVGDVLVVRIDESETAVRNAKTSLGKKRSNQYGSPDMLGLLSALHRKYPNLDPSMLFSSQMSSSSDGTGSIERRGRLTATLPVRVRRVMPNGDLYIEGTNVVMVSSEEHHLYVSGIIRRIDIREDNTVLSSRIADAEIEYVGRGDVSDQQRPGWGKRAIDRAHPF